jgi:hypothetical protein
MMNENDFGEYMLHMRKREKLETLAAGVQNLKGPMECTVIIRSGLPFEDIASDARGPQTLGMFHDRTQVSHVNDVTVA